MLSEEDVKEQLSVNYVHAVATKATFSCQVVSVDRDSVDVTVRAKGGLVDEAEILSPALDLQLKSEVEPEIDGGEVLHDLKMENYEELRGGGYDLNRVLVLLALPEQFDSWLECGPEQLVARRCCYWYSLRELPEVGNQSTRRVRLPEDQRFTPESLTGMMETIARGEEVTNVAS